MDKETGQNIIAAVFSVGVLGTIGFFFIRGWFHGFLNRKTLPWRVVRAVNRYGNEDFRIQQQWLGRWWTTYEFCYGCTDPVRLETNFREFQAKLTRPRVEVVQEYKPVDRKPKAATVKRKRNKRTV